MDGSVTGMDENRWLHAGPGMVALFAVIGLIVGILAGLFNPAGTQREPGQDLSDQRSEETTTTHAATLPDTFYTVVLASVSRSKGRSGAEARAEAFRTEGVKDAGVLDPTRYSTLADDFWAVYSGVFESHLEATQHRDKLRNRFPDLAGAYVKFVRNVS